MNIYLVGGAVRDQILGIPSEDKDWVVVGETAQAMLDAGFKPIPAENFPIFTLDGDEYALARKERKTKGGKGYKGFDVFTSPDVTLEEDLLRRDLTINALAMTDDGLLVDPYNGRQDIDDRILRHRSTAFNEDPVRILRVARFMAKLGDFDFSVAEETMQLMTQMVNAGEADHLTPERVWKEMEKALKSSHPERFFETLHACGALKRLMPELHSLIDVPQSITHHPENCVFQHTLLSLRQAAILGNRNPVISFAVLMHDLGKGITPKEILPSHHGHEKTGLPLVTAFCNRFKAPNAYRDLAMKVTQHHLRSHKSMQMRAGSIVGLLDELGALKNGLVLEHFLTACESDAKGRLGFSERDYPQADYLRSIHQAVVAMDTKPIIEKYQGQGAVIGWQIKQAMMRVAHQTKETLLSNAEESTPRM